jgi:hypothetical protein
MRKRRAFLRAWKLKGQRIKAGQVQLDFPVIALADSLYLRSVFPGRSITLRKPYLLTSSSRLSNRRRGSSFGSGLCALSSSYVSVRCILYLKDLYSCFQCLPIPEPLQTLLPGLPCRRRCVFPDVRLSPVQGLAPSLNRCRA